MRGLALKESGTGCTQGCEFVKLGLVYQMLENWTNQTIPFDFEGV